MASASYVACAASADVASAAADDDDIPTGCGNGSGACCGVSAPL